MRRVPGALLFAALAVATAHDPRPASAQPDNLQTKHWALSSVGVPLNADEVKRFFEDQKLPAPAHAQLYYALNRGKFQAGPKLALDNLDPLDNNKRGFQFKAPKDGEYDLAVQYHFADGKVDASAEELRPVARYVIDTTPPDVQLRASGNGVEWAATDANLDPASIKVECKVRSSVEWQAANVPPARLKPVERFAWKLSPGDVMDVRVSARDRAGNEGKSTIVRLPSEGGGGGTFPRPNPGAGDWPPPNNNGGLGTAPQPTMQYVKTADFEVESKIEKVGRSGIKAVHLWVQKDTGVDWVLASTKRDVGAVQESQTLYLPYKADKPGTYGFYVIPESGVGKKPDDPKRGDKPQVYVVYDNSPPAVKITAINVRAGGSGGPLVEITWEAGDQNLIPNGINVEYADAKTPGVWKEIKYKASNNAGPQKGRIEWEVPDPDLWKFKVRVRATDQAANTNEDVWSDDVLVDLDKPAASATGVRQPGGERPPSNNPPAAIPPKPADERVPPKKKENDPKLGPAEQKGPNLPPLPMSGGSGM